MQTSNVVKMSAHKARRGFHEQEAMKATRGKRNKTQRHQRQEWAS